ncbi:hypothetical protein ACFQH3_08965 [Haladaptatus sp. GCM10025707]|uniref:DUF7289 family protein n=1 Tax=unclassified Haladaptatus TaxID=2622732 RepID=UPI0023E82354|nr:MULTISPECIES: hypothetical protein [unclassified Haladaptatus]
MDNRAVSEVLGFILIFSLISLTIGVIYVTGLGGLADTRDAERVNNAERAFDVLAHNMEDISEHGAPSRATEVRLADAQLSVNEEVEIQYTFIDQSGVTEPTSLPVVIKPIVYDSQTGTDIVYEAGAVIREQPDTARMVREPGFVFDEDNPTNRNPLFMIVQTTSTTNQDIGGSKTVRVRAIHESTVVESTGSNGPYTMKVSVTSPRFEAWESYFEGKCNDVTTTDTTVTCTLENVDKGYVTKVQTTIEIE